MPHQNERVAPSAMKYKIQAVKKELKLTKQRCAPIYEILVYFSTTRDPLKFVTYRALIYAHDRII